MRTVLRYVRPRLPQITLGLLIKFVGTVVELLLPWMLSVILDRYAPAGDRAMIWRWGALMILCAGVSLAGNVTANRMATRTSRDITQRLRSDLFAKVTSLSCTQEDAFTTPSLIARLTSDTYNVHQLIDRMQRLGVRAPILLIGGIGVSMALEPVLTLVLIVTLPLLGFLIWKVTGKGIKLYARTQTQLDRMVRRAQESMTGIRVIQALSKADYERGRFDEANRNVVECEQRADLLMNLTNPIMNLLLNTGLTAVIVLGAYRVSAGVTGPGTIIAFLSYFTVILNALMMVSRMFMLYSKGAASARRVAEVLTAPSDMTRLPEERIPSEEKPEQPFLPGETPPVLPEVCVEFDHVTFSYDKLRDNLTDISFSLRRGETLGIIGPTGSGKSTVLRLLLRFYDADGGTVRLFGRDVRSMPQAELHSLFGVAFQNDFLYAATVAENVDFARGLDPQARLAALRTAQADFVFSRAGGPEGTIASKGQDLSGGQKQRLLLARALAGRPAILLLDDSSSALDYKTDAAFRRALASAAADAVKIIVAQRVSSIAHADHILVLENGAAAGYGTHEELLASCAGYREIARVQMEEGT